MLQIRLFGKPQVICDGTDITPELGNKGCALLCILFLRGGDYYAREKLAAYLWPDSAASAAKYNLRYTLWKIKKSTDTGEGGRSLIKLDREYCCIDRAYDYICDLQTIDEIDPETRSADELKRACDAFGGELLEGYYFNHCEDLNELILSQRIYYEKRKNRLLMKAAELYEQRDMLPEAVAAALRPSRRRAACSTGTLPSGRPTCRTRAWQSTLPTRPTWRTARLYPTVPSRSPWRPRPRR